MKQGWEIKKLGEVCSINYGTRVVQKKDGGTIFPVYGGGGATFRMDKYNREDCLVVSRFAMSSQCVRYVEGKFFLNDSGLTIETNSPKLKQSFLDKHIIAYNDKIYSLGKGAAQRNLDIKALKEVSINYPSIAEQEKIVAELDCLSGIIEKKKQQLKELDNLAQSIFYEMFGDPVENDKGWEMKRLGDISQSQIGITYKPENVSDDDNGTIVLRSGNIQESALCFNDIVRVNCDIKEQKYVQKGDILMCSRNGSHRLVGKVAMIPELSEKMTYGAFMTIIRSDYQSYLFAFFKTPAFRSQLTSAQTATINQITVKMLNEIIVALPPIALQKDFASKIEAIEKQKELIAQSIKETETLFNSRMDYYFG